MARIASKTDLDQILVWMQELKMNAGILNVAQFLVIRQCFLYFAFLVWCLFGHTNFF